MCFKGAHYVFATEERLPRLTIDLFAKSNGVIIKVGDASHPNGIEVVACYRIGLNGTSGCFNN